jgi:hypothetical protein
MIIGIQGSRSFDDYTIFLRAMGTALSSMEKGDEEFLIYSAGPSKVNSMAMEFSNISERTLKSQGIRIRVIKVAPSFIKQNIHDLSYFAYFCRPKETVSDLVTLADNKSIDVGVYRY